MSPVPPSFGCSPCPNDTFAFWALLHDAVPCPVPFAPVLADIEALNERAVRGDDPLMVSKLSLPALAQCAGRYRVLPSGAALGFGCGPLLVSREHAAFDDPARLADLRVAVPGEHTTAFLLLRSLLPAPRVVVPMRFDRILPAVAAGECDAGLVIHESRFTYREYGLRELCDLGVLWERATGGPLPLAVIGVHRDVDERTAIAIGAAIRASVRLARREPERPRPWIRAHAQELADAVCDRHIALYVNDFSEALGEVGRRAVEELLRRGHAAGLLPAVDVAFVPEAS